MKFKINVRSGMDKAPNKAWSKEVSKLVNQLENEVALYNQSCADIRNNNRSILAMAVKGAIDRRIQEMKGK